MGYLSAHPDVNAGPTAATRERTVNGPEKNHDLQPVPPHDKVSCSPREDRFPRIVALREQNADEWFSAAEGRQPKGVSRRNQAACQMESRSWGNLTRRAGNRSPALTGQVIGHKSSPVLQSAEQRLSGEIKGTPPERSHVPTAAHGLPISITNQAAAARCRGNLPLGSLSFDAPASTFHFAARALLLLPSRIVALRERNTH